jgi:hypothetical protein
MRKILARSSAALPIRVTRCTGSAGLRRAKFVRMPTAAPAKVIDLSRLLGELDPSTLWIVLASGATPSQVDEALDSLGRGEQPTSPHAVAVREMLESLWLDEPDLDIAADL